MEPSSRTGRGGDEGRALVLDAALLVDETAFPAFQRGVTEAAHRWGANSWSAHKWGAHKWGAHKWGAHKWGANSWSAHKWAGDDWVQPYLKAYAEHCVDKYGLRDRIRLNSAVVGTSSATRAGGRTGGSICSRSSLPAAGGCRAKAGCAVGRLRPTTISSSNGAVPFQGMKSHDYIARGSWNGCAKAKFSSIPPALGRVSLEVG